MLFCIACNPTWLVADYIPITDHRAPGATMCQWIGLLPWWQHHWTPKETPILSEVKFTFSGSSGSVEVVCTLIASLPGLPSHCPVLDHIQWEEGLGMRLCQSEVVWVSQRLCESIMFKCQRLCKSIMFKCQRLCEWVRGCVSQSCLSVRGCVSESEVVWVSQGLCEWVRGCVSESEIV